MPAHTAVANGRQPLVEVDGVSKVYDTADGSILALDRVSLSIDAGEFLSIVGPSGCGKSTMMLVVAGLIRATTGVVRIGGDEVRRPYRDVGIVFQDANLYDWRRVLENVTLPAQIQGLDKAQSRQHARDLLDLVGLAGFEKKYPFELSGGMRQRVALCRALVHDPTLLLMDEPFGALDALTRDQLNLELQSIWQRDRKTVLFITHSINEAVFLSDRVIVMSPRPGKIGTVVDINLPRPRSFETTENPAFAHYTHEIRGIFESWGVLGSRAGRAVRGVAD